MEAQTNHEKSRLDAIERKVRDVQDKLNARLPAQFRHVSALVCGAKWRLQALGPQDAAAVKKTRLELGAFDYRVKEQAEQLTRCLLELDDVLSHGDADVRSARKALVLFVQQLLPQADAFKERSAKLKQFGEAVLAGFADQVPSTSSTPSDSGSESDDMHVKALFQESDEEEEEDSASEAEEEGEVKQEDDDDEEMVKAADVEEDESMEPEAEVDEEADDEAEDNDEEEEREIAPPHKLPRIQPGGDRQPLETDVSSLPEWRPYYQLQRRQDSIYLIARLNRIDPRNVRVQWNEHNGVLRVNGFRLPTQKDILMSRLSGAPTFGRFEIAEQFPRHMLDMEEATQQIFEDGTLQIRMPFRVVRRPMRYRPASFFQPQDCFVW